jgi:hypothetical protein
MPAQPVLSQNPPVLHGGAGDDEDNEAVRSTVRPAAVPGSHRPDRATRRRDPGDRESAQRISGTRKCLYQFTAIDDCTRIQVLKVYDKCIRRAAIQFLNEVRQRLPFRIEVLQTDNGAEFQCR